MEPNKFENFDVRPREDLLHFTTYIWFPASVGTGATKYKSQIVRTPLRVFYDCMGKPDWIVFSLKSPIDFTV